MASSIDGLVSRLSSSFIPPASPAHTPRCFALSDADTAWLSYPHNQSILFYTLPKGAHYPSLVAHLGHSLSLALTHHFFLAGMLATLEDGSLVLHCNHRGAEFVEAACEDVCVDDLESTHFQMHPPFYSKLVPLGDRSLSQDLSLPLLSVQVTRLGDDGVAVGVASAHAVLDGASFWTFMASWSECGRGLPISTPPLHMRCPVESPRFKYSSSPLPAGEEEAEGRPKLEERVFHFSPEALAKLKSVSTQNGGGPYSSYECLCAHLWRRATAAQRVAGEQKLRLALVVNARRRLEPPLPDGYFGNSLFPIRLYATAGELLGRDNLASTASKIHEAILACNDAMIKSFRKHVQDCGFDEAFGDRSDMVKMTVANSPKFPVYELDFGFGRPAAVRPASVRKEDVVMLFAGREGRGSVDVCMGLPREVMQHLENDTELLLV